MPLGYPASLSVYNVLSNVPPGVNRLEQVFRTHAAAPSSSQPSSHSSPPRTIRHKHSQSLAVMETPPAPTPRPTTRNRGFSRNRRRLASIFDLSEEELLLLGVQTKRALPQIVTDDLPRASIDSAETSASTTHNDDDDSPMFTLSNNSSTSTLPTDVSRPASPVEATPTTPSKRKRGANVQSLTLDLKPDANSAYSPYPFTPRNANTGFTGPASPLSPTTPAVADIQARRLAKLTRTLGENVPPELVFGVGKVTKGRRASLSSTVEAAAPAVRVDPSKSDASRSTARPTRRARANTTTRPRSRAPFTGPPAEQEPDTTFTLPPMSPVFTSDRTQVSGGTWVGSWNRPDMHVVQAELRALRWR